MFIENASQLFVLLFWIGVFILFKKSGFTHSKIIESSLNFETVFYLSAIIYKKSKAIILYFIY